MSKSQTLRFDDGAVQFRQRIVVSLLSHRPLLIRNIRANDLQHPGLKDYEASFLRLKVPWCRFHGFANTRDLVLVRVTPKCHPELAGEGIKYLWALSKIPILIM